MLDMQGKLARLKLKETLGLAGGNGRLGLRLNEVPMLGTGDGTWNLAIRAVYDEEDEEILSIGRLRTSASLADLLEISIRSTS
ncbi:hypothetical protein M407DRAFT_17944 [Tulasnella calospora MUT 4182]|uniref:Uncharacterized protein n=1 Tax=Tulasnella calospora MUT 4182 TaxID=1051891 RepID=A0A0C3QKK6_9AGAM|nr:hypothetical protein M407DRAFT_17944 [Tulasnella calospora MUT 4182]